MTARTLIPLAGLLLAGPAFARPMSTLWVDNDFGGPVQVVVDGRALGTVRPHEDGMFPVPMGHHHVTVHALNGFVLASDTDWFAPYRTGEVHIRPPMAPLTVRNTGSAPLFVDGIGDGLWLQPGMVRTTYVPAGAVRLTASTSAGRGLRPVEHETVWVQPGAGGHVAFDWCPPPTRLVVTNQEPVPVRVLVDGRPVGPLAPGASLHLDVAPGLHDVDVWSAYGGLIVDTQVRVVPGTDASIAVYRPRPRGPSHGPGHGQGGHAHHGHGPAGVAVAGHTVGNGRH